MRVKPTTLKREFSPLHNLFEVARNEWGFPLRANPLSRVGIRLLTQRRERRLKDGELDTLLLATNSCRNTLVRPIILFAIATGMRRSEILNLRWVDIHRETSSLLISNTKNGYSRIIPLTTAMLEILDELPRSDDRVFPITANALRLAWDRVRERAGITDLHFHDLRHEAVSRFFEKGLNVPEVALISGHRDPRMLFRYTHPKPHAIAEKLRNESL